MENLFKEPKKELIEEYIALYRYLKETDYPNIDNILLYDMTRLKYKIDKTIKEYLEPEL